VQAAQDRVAAAEAHAARVVSEAEASAAAVRRVRDELAARLSEARRVLSALPDLADRPQQRPAPAPQGQPGQQPPQGQPGQQRPGATEEARVTRPEGPPTVAQPVAGPQTGMQRAVGPQTGGQAPLRPTPHARTAGAPGQGAGGAAAASQPTASPSTQPAVPQPESPSSERTQAIRPVHGTGQEEARPPVGPGRGAGEAVPAEDAAGRQDPPTLVQPAVGLRDTGDQAAVPGRR
jgi:hypothetical protein